MSFRKSSCRRFIRSLILASTFVFPGQITGNELIINEILASNDTAYSPNGGQTFPDAIELHNLTNVTIDISGYGISDDDSAGRWLLPSNTLIPANGFLIVIANDAANGLETDFKLSAGGELVHLTDPAGATVDRVTFNRQRTDISYGRLSDGSYAFFPMPSIGAANDDASSIASLVKRPDFDRESGIYSGSISVTLSAEPGTEIRYTLDGSNPTTRSPLYTSSLIITPPTQSTAPDAPIMKGTVLKTIAILNGETSEIGMRTFLFDVSHDLPIVILTSENFADRKIDPVTPQNERELYSYFQIDGRIRFDFLETDGSLPISQYTEFRASGRNSREIPPINGKIEAAGKFGKNQLSHRFFPEKIEETKFKRLLLRNTSQDFADARIRDGVFSRFLSTGDIVEVDYEGYRPCVLYLNGRYLGHMNLREDDDETFAKQYFDLAGRLSKGRLTGGGNIFVFNRHNLVNPIATDAIEQINAIRRVNESLLDDALRDSMQLYNTDRFTTRWRSISNPSQTRRISLHDYDSAFKLFARYRDDDLDPPTTWDTISWDISLDPAGEDIRFWEETAQHTAAYRNLFAWPDRMEQIIDAVSAEVRSEMPATIDFYKRRRLEVNRPLPSDFNEIRDLVAESMMDWETSVQFVRNFPRLRLMGSLDAIKTGTSLPELVDVTISSANSTMGDVRVHGYKVTSDRETGAYFSTYPIQLSAEPKPGHVFVRWEGDVSGSDVSIAPSFTSDAVVNAVFAPTGIAVATAGHLAISEIFYNPLGLQEDDEFLELLNLTNAPLDLGGVSFVQGISYTFPGGTILPANGRIVIRPSNYQGNLSNDGERLTYLDANRQEIESLVYGDGDPWPEAADGLGHSLVRIRPTDASSPSSPLSWRLSVSAGGNPNTDDFTPLTDFTPAGLLQYVFGEQSTQLSGILTGDVLNLRFSKNISVDDVTISLYQSPNLAEESWIPVPSTQLLSEEIPFEGMETVIIEGLATSAPSNFFRLEVTVR